MLFLRFDDADFGMRDLRRATEPSELLRFAVLIFADEDVDTGLRDD